MKGVKPIRTVGDLMAYLQACPQDADVLLMPEDGEGFVIGGVLQFSDIKPPHNCEVWILIDEFGELKSEEWSDECGEGCERPGDMAVILEEEKPDSVQVRGQMRSA